MLGKVLYFGIFLFGTSSQVDADTWIDTDGDSAVAIEKDVLSIYSIGDFYYFDQLFTYVRSGGKLRLCLGFDDGPGTASDCLGFFSATLGFNNEGKTRSLHILAIGNEYTIFAFEEDLRSGRKMKVSIDNGDLFSAYSLHQSNALKSTAKVF